MNQYRTWLRAGLTVCICLLLLTLAACSGSSPGEVTSPANGNGEEQPAGDQSPGESGTGQVIDEDDPRDQGDVVFSIYDIEVGDVIAGMEVVAIESASGDDAGHRDPHDAIIRFTGRKTISGRYTYFPPNDEFLANIVCMFIGDGVAAGLPQMAEDERTTSFCFANEDVAQAAFREPSAGTATVIIDDYTIVYYPSEVWNTATLVEAHAVAGRPLTKAITTYPEGMEQTDLYHLADIFWVPVTTYIPVDWEYRPAEDVKGDGMLLLPPVAEMGPVEIVLFPAAVSADEAENLARQRLEQEGFVDPAATETGEEWALLHLQAEDRQDSDPGAWRMAHLYLGRHGDRYFYVLNQLNRLEAVDGWETIIDVMFAQWLWTDTGEPLRGSLP